MHARRLALLALGLLAPAVPAADWARFRGPDGLGTAPTRTICRSTFGPKDVLWKTPDPRSRELVADRLEGEGLPSDRDRRRPQAGPGVRGRGDRQDRLVART